jgi:hypothetical protein
MSETSFKLKVEQSFNNIFFNYIQQISLKYKIPRNELLHLWNGNVEKKDDGNVEKKDDGNVEKKDDGNVEKKDDGNVEKKDDGIDPEKILKASKAELVAMCKKEGKKCSGTKTELISRLVSKSNEKKKKNKKKELKTPPVIKKINASIPAIQIRKNKFGNYEHVDTGLIFNKHTKKVIGKQHSDGQIIELSHSDIDLCNKYKFSYNLPENLNKKSSLDDIQIDDLDSDNEDNNKSVDDNQDKENIEESKSEDEEEDVDLEEFYDD